MEAMKGALSCAPGRINGWAAGVVVELYEALCSGRELGYDEEGLQEDELTAEEPGCQGGFEF